MRDHFSKAHEHLRAQLANLLSAVFAEEESAHIAVGRIFASGYDLARDDVPTPLHDRAAKLSSVAEKNDVRNGDTMGWRSEEIAVEMWQSRRNWAATTSLESDIAAKQSARAKAEKDREAAIAKRAKDILAANQARAVADARTQAEFEARNR